MRLVFALAVISTSLISWATPQIESSNLIPNPNFEGGTKPNGLPRHWSSWMPMPGPTAKLAQDQKHDGKHAGFIETKADSTMFLLSDAIPVVPGEKLTMSAWCRTEDFSTTTGGTAGIAAGWMDANRQYLSAADYTTVPLATNHWFQITREITPPARAAYVIVQLRHRGVTGKSWWDQVELKAASPVALRLALFMPNAEPGNTTMPAKLINRLQDKAGSRIKIHTNPGNLTQIVKLPRTMETTITVGFNIKERGTQVLSAEIMDELGTKLFTGETTATVPPPLVMEPVLPVYSCVEDGAQSLESRIWIHEPEELRPNLTLHCSVLRKAAVPASMPPIAEAQVSPPTIENRLTFKIPPLPKGDYVVYAQLENGKDVVAADSQDWHIISRAQATVTLSDDGYPIIGGKKTFPMGMYDGSHFSDLADAGFNVTQNFDVGHVRRGWIPDNQRMKRILDDSMEAGMKHLFLVVHGPGCRVLDDEYLRRLKMFKNHPAVLAWYEEEGVARGDVPLSFVKTLRDTVKKVAPEHPLVLGDTRDVITKVSDRSNFFPVDYLDIATWWWYPFPIKKASRPGAYEGEEIGTGLELVPPSYLVLAKTKKPIWVTLQCYKKNENGRFPTEAEYRAQPYISVIYGAKGIFYYTGLDVQHKPQEGHYDYLKKVVSELREMSPVFMSHDSTETVKLAAPNDLICFRLKDSGDNLVLLAANRNDKPTDVTFEVPWARSGANTVKYENRDVKIVDGKLSDHFEGYAVHIYELAK